MSINLRLFEKILKKLKKPLILQYRGAEGAEAEGKNAVYAVGGGKSVNKGCCKLGGHNAQDGAGKSTTVHACGAVANAPCKLDCIGNCSVGFVYSAVLQLIEAAVAGSVYQIDKLVHIAAFKCRCGLCNTAVFLEKVLGAKCRTFTNYSQNVIILVEKGVFVHFY